MQEKYLSLALPEEHLKLNGLWDEEAQGTEEPKPLTPSVDSVRAAKGAARGKPTKAVRSEPRAAEEAAKSWGGKSLTQHVRDRGGEKYGRRSRRRPGMR